MTQLDATSLVTYLLDCMPFLRDNDLTGWKQQYQPTSPATSTTAVSKKTCHQCQNNYLIHDRVEDTVVCTTCGTVVDATGLGTDIAHMSVDRITHGTRHVVHRYSRLVYFKSFLASIQGNTRPTNVSAMLRDLRATIDGPVSVRAVCDALRKLRKSTQYRRHATTLALKLDPTLSVPTISDHQLAALITMFHKVERYWDVRFKHSLKRRKSFISYPYLLYQFSFHLGYHDLTQSRFLLKDIRLRQFQHYMYRQLCHVFNWRCDTDC